MKAIIKYALSYNIDDESLSLKGGFDKGVRGQIRGFEGASE